MSAQNLVASRLDLDLAVVDETCAAGEPWVKLVKKGQIGRAHV